MTSENEENRWLVWAKELQSLAQCGLAYTENAFDRERFERVREIAAEMVALKSEISVERVRGLFCNETGFQTPKIDTRAAVFRNGRILLVRENDGRWSLPGGWCDANQSVRSNTVKEVREEAGMEVEPIRLIAVQDRNRRNKPLYVYNVCKIFVLCRFLGGQFRSNLETTAADWFSLDDLPELSEGKTNRQQVELCFRASEDDDFPVEFD